MHDDDISLQLGKVVTISPFSYEPVSPEIRNPVFRSGRWVKAYTII